MASGRAQRITVVSRYLREFARISVMIAAPHAIIDTADVAGSRLKAMLCAAAREMVPGQVMEIVSRTPGSAGPVEEWCSAGGHSLLERVVRGPNYLYWVRTS